MLGVSVKNKVRKGMKVVSDKLASVQSTEKNNPETPTEEKDAKTPDQTQGEQHLGDATMDNAQREQPPAQELSKVEQAILVNKENALVLHASVENSSEVNTSEKKVTNDEPPVKKLKFLILTSLISSTTPLNSSMPKPLQKPNAMTIDQFTKHLTKTTSSIFSPTLSRELPPPRDPTPPGDKLQRERGMMNCQLGSYRISSSHDATMRIIRGKDPLNVVVHNKFRLNTLGFSEWLEVITQAKYLGIPPPPELSTFGVLVNDKKRKRTSEILQEVFVKENIVVDGMQKNLIPPSSVVGSRGQVIREPESRIFFYNENFDLVFQREEEFHLATTAQLIREQSAIQKGLAEWKASASNLKCIQVKDIDKDVEDHLKTYSSIGMDISCVREFGVVTPATALAGVTALLNGVGSGVDRPTRFNAAYKRAKRLGKSGENDVDVLKRAQSIYRDEHKGVAFCQDAWAILKFHPKWDAPEQVDLIGDVPGATQEDLFDHDAQPRPAGKPRPAKKTKSDATASTVASSASTQFGELMGQELRLKREAAERAFEAQAEKDRTLIRLGELRFLATSTKDLDDDDAYWIKKQKRLIKNEMRNDLGDEDE
nr:hypothetical protein [Tanacetum cinerariifolium]